MGQLTDYIIVLYITWVNKGSKPGVDKQGNPDLGFQAGVKIIRVKLKGKLQDRTWENLRTLKP